MELKKWDYNLTVYEVKSMVDINLETEFFFIGKADKEFSLACRTVDTLQHAK